MIRTRNKNPGHVTPPPTPKRLSPSIRLDAIHPQDYFRYRMPIACEDCTHFDSANVACTMGYNARKHLHAEQLRTYELSGRVALCRALEID